MLGNIASHKKLWMSGIKYQRKLIFQSLSVGLMLYIFYQFGGSSLNIFQLYDFFFVYHWPYTYLGLPSLQYRRLRADRVEIYKILNNIDKVQYEQILPLNQTTTRVYLPVYLFPGSGIWAIQPLGPFLIICFHLPVGRYLVNILYPDFSNDCSHPNPTLVRLVKEWILMLKKKQLIWKLLIYWYLMSFFHKKNVTKCLGHHYAINTPMHILLSNETWIYLL
jgi:hypothetical protein